MSEFNNKKDDEFLNGLKEISKEVGIEGVGNLFSVDIEEFNIWIPGINSEVDNILSNKNK